MVMRPTSTRTPRRRRPHLHRLLVLSITATILSRNNLPLRRRCGRTGHHLCAAAATTALPPGPSRSLPASSLGTSINIAAEDAGGGLGLVGGGFEFPSFSSPTITSRPLRLRRASMPSGFVPGDHRPARRYYSSIRRPAVPLIPIASPPSSRGGRGRSLLRNPSSPRWGRRGSSGRPYVRCGGPLTPARGIFGDYSEDGATPPRPFEDGDEDEDEDDTISSSSFIPKFDGQLYYGLPSNENGEVSTTMSEIRKRVGMDQLERIGLGSDYGSVSGRGGVDDPEDDLLNASTGDEARAKHPEKPGGEEEEDTTTIASHHERLFLRPRERARIRNIPCISRTVPITPSMDVTVYEMESPSELVRRWMERHDDPSRDGDPFGVVMWPGSIQASRELIRMSDAVENSTVLVLGAGSGVEVQVAARLGARRVVATDVNTFTLELLRHGAERAGYGDVVETRLFDITDEDQALPLLRDGEVDVVVASDVLYNERLADAVGMRCGEILDRSGPLRPALIVTDSQRFHGTDFLRKLNRERAGVGSAALEWEEVTLGNVTGSGILIEGDQTYDVRVRMLSLDGFVEDSHDEGK